MDPGKVTAGPIVLRAQGVLREGGRSPCGLAYSWNATDQCARKVAYVMRGPRAGYWLLTLREVKRGLQDLMQGTNSLSLIDGILNHEILGHKSGFDQITI